MTETLVLKWIKANLGDIMRVATTGTMYTEDWLAGMAMRETGILLFRYLPSATNIKIIAPIMKGDYSQRKNETEKTFHGYGFWQIDTGSYREFIRSGDWKDPLKTAKKAVEVLEEKRKYLVTHLPPKSLPADQLQRAITASYNCGPVRVLEALAENHDVDHYTFSNNYSKEVWRYRDIYKSLASPDATTP
jgi:hypothetical protein